MSRALLVLERIILQRICFVYMAAHVQIGSAVGVGVEYEREGDLNVSRAQYYKGQFAS